MLLVLSFQFRFELFDIVGQLLLVILQILVIALLKVSFDGGLLHLQLSHVVRNVRKSGFHLFELLLEGLHRSQLRLELLLLLVKLLLELLIFFEKVLVLFIELLHHHPVALLLRTGTFVFLALDLLLLELLGVVEVHVELDDLLIFLSVLLLNFEHRLFQVLHFSRQGQGGELQRIDVIRRSSAHLTWLPCAHSAPEGVVVEHLLMFDQTLQMLSNIRYLRRVVIRWLKRSR